MSRGELGVAALLVVALAGCTRDSAPTAPQPADPPSGPPITTAAPTVKGLEIRVVDSDGYRVVRVEDFRR